MDVVWEIYTNHLHLLHRGFGVDLYAFVLMTNHYHLLAKFREGNLSAAMNYFQRETARAIAKESGRINHVYGNRFFHCTLTAPHHFEHAYKYAYRNPAEAGLCVNVEDYKYSTLNGLLGAQPLLIPVTEDKLLFDDPEGTIKWLNTPVDPEDRDFLRRALRRKEFRLPIDRKTKKPHPLEVRRY